MLVFDKSEGAITEIRPTLRARLGCHCQFSWLALQTAVSSESGYSSFNWLDPLVAMVILRSVM